MAELKEGQKSPDFILESSEGRKISLKDFKGKKNVVLYFYPKDMTSGCTLEACSFRDNLARVEKAGAVVLGVSTDDVVSHQKFTYKHQLNFPLLADTDKELLKLTVSGKRKNCMVGNIWELNELPSLLIKMAISPKSFPKSKWRVIRKMF